MVLCYSSLSRLNQGACDPVWASIRCSYRVLLGLLERRTFLYSCLEAGIMQSWSLQELLLFIPTPPTSMKKHWLKIKPIQWKAELKDREIDFYWYCLTNWIQPCLKLEYPTLTLNEPPIATPPSFQSRAELGSVIYSGKWFGQDMLLASAFQELKVLLLLSSYQVYLCIRSGPFRRLLMSNGYYSHGAPFSLDLNAQLQQMGDIHTEGLTNHSVS